MYLFSRTVNLHGSPRKTLPWVQGVTELVNANSPLDVSVWLADFGLPLNTIVWNAVVESQAQLADATAPLLAHDGYLDHLEAGQEFITVPGEDALREMVHGTPTENQVGSVAHVTTGTANVDRIGDAMAWSIEIAQYVEKLTGHGVSVWSSAFGQMGEITFISVGASVAEAEAANNATNADAGYIERLHASKDLWVPGSGQVGRFTRII
jgi:hypothetical protein